MADDSLVGIVASTDTELRFLTMQGNNIIYFLVTRISFDLNEILSESLGAQGPFGSNSY